MARRVLVVDDRPAMAEMIADALRDRGYEAVSVSSGREGLRVLRSEHVDALITDLRMPDIDGIELLRASNALDPRRPVILMTAFEASGSAALASGQGVFHLLTKPFRLDALARALEQALGLR